MVGLAVALLLTLQPVGSASGCRVDLSDPASPRLYGDCVGSYEDIDQSEEEIEYTRQTTLGLGVGDPGECQGPTCGASVSQEITITLRPEEGGSSVDAEFDVAFGDKAAGDGGLTSLQTSDCGLEAGHHFSVLIPCSGTQLL